MIPHLGYIVAAFGVTFVVIAGMVGAIVLDHRDLAAKLAKLDDRRDAR